MHHYREMSTEVAQTQFLKFAEAGDYEGHNAMLQAALASVTEEEEARKGPFRLNLNGLNLSGLTLDGFLFKSVNLKNSDMRNVSAVSTDFSRASVSRLNLENADLSGAKMVYVYNINSAFLRGANLAGVHLRGGVGGSASLTGPGNESDRGILSPRVHIDTFDDLNRTYLHDGGEAHGIRVINTEQGMNLTLMESLAYLLLKGHRAPDSDETSAHINVIDALLAQALFIQKNTDGKQWPAATEEAVKQFSAALEVPPPVSGGPSKVLAPKAFA